MAYAMKGYQARAKKEYIATAPFNLKFFTYTVTGPTAASLTTTGLMTYVTGATAGNCPAGRILREIGARIFPGANPGLQSGETGYNSVVTHGEHIFTKVFDAVTGLNGYIDANDAIFATYSNELPVEFVDDGETDGSTSRRGASVYTGGDVTAVGNVVVSGTGLIGYNSTGTPASVTQGTNKATTVTLNTQVGRITMNAASLASNTAVTFQLTNSSIGSANDVIIVNLVGTLGLSYSIVASCTAASTASISIKNITAGALTDAVVIQYVILKGISLT